MLKVLGGFHHRAAKRITGMTATHWAVREWKYHPLLVATKATGIQSIMEYIRRLHATIAEKMACRPSYELCVQAIRRTGMSLMVRWWDQNVVNEPVE